MIPRDLSRDIKTRLQSINGQINGLVKMFETEDDAEKSSFNLKRDRKV